MFINTQLKEADDTNTFAPDPNKKEEVTYDGNTYTLRIWVTMDKNGNNTPSGTVDKVEKVVVTDKNANKVDPTPVTPTPTPDTPVDPDHPVVPTPEPNKTFNFKNIYTVTASDKPFDGNDPKTAPFWISKEVKGQMADNTLDFDYTLDIAANELTAGKDYELNIKRTNDDVDKVKVTPGTPATFKLKHGEIAYFEKDPSWSYGKCQKKQIQLIMMKQMKLLSMGKHQLLVLLKQQEHSEQKG